MMWKGQPYRWRKQPVEKSWGEKKYGLFEELQDEISVHHTETQS